MEEKNLSLKEYFNLCVKFENDPTEDNQKDIEKFLAELQVKEYMPLKEKAVICMTILSEINDDFDSIGTASALEMGKIFHGLMSYVINLDNDIGVLSRTYAGYDLTMRYGLCDKILSYCAKDYDRLCRYVEGASNASNIYRLIQTASLLNSDELEKWNNLMGEVKNTFTPDFMKSIEETNLANKDVTKELISALADNSLARAQKIILEEKEKYEKIAEDLEKKSDNKLKDSEKDINKI